jgi:hypothetical protein
MNTLFRFSIFVICALSFPALAGVITSLPGAPGRVRGNFVMGTSYDNRGYLYDVTTGMTRYIPNTSGVGGISGNFAVGVAGSHGFIYNLSTNAYSTLVNPFGAPITLSRDIQGSLVLGSYQFANGDIHGFLYDIVLNTWRTLDYPGASGTSLRGISGDNIVGLAYGVGGVLYNLRTAQWSVFDNLDPYSISGNNVSGSAAYYGPTIYNLANGNYFNPVRGKAQFPSFGFMNSINDYNNGIAVGGYTYLIQGRTSIGYYAYSVPEASTWLLVGLAMTFFAAASYRRTRSR